MLAPLEQSAERGRDEPSTPRPERPACRQVRAMQFGAHMSSAGGIYTAIDRIEAIGGDCVQVFTQSPRMWRPTAHKPEAIERFRARRAEAGIGGVVCHALYLCNLAAPDDVIHEKSVAALRATVDTAGAIEADAVIFHVGSHLGAGLRRRRSSRGRARARRRSSTAARATRGSRWRTRPGTGGTIGRSIDELATLRRRARPPPAARDLPRLVPPLRLGLRRHRPGGGRRARRRGRRRRSASTASARST